MNEENERSFGDWRQSDKGDSVWWALAFIWGALILLAENINYASNFPWWDGWAVFLTGVGIFALIGFILRLLKPEFPSPSFWDLMFVFIVLGIGMGGYSIWFWPLALGIIGLVILLNVLRSSE